MMSREDVIEALKKLAEKHRANGCRVFDDPFAGCTCPDLDDTSSWENEGGYYVHEKD